jgi:hypothetical protein
MTTEHQETSAVEQVQEKAGELKSQAGDRVREQVDERSTQAGEQAQAMTQALRSRSEHLRSEGHDTPAKLIDGAADRVDRLGSYLRDSDSNRLLNDAEGWARSRPWVAAAAGALVGFAASRFLKASSSRRYEQQFTSSNGGTTYPSHLTAGAPPGAM